MREARIPRAGQVLDVATGTRKVALAAARVVGFRGRELPSESLARLRLELLDDIETPLTGKGIWLDSSALFGVGVK